MEEGSEEYRLARAKLDLNHQLARLGLKGTLWGAWATLIALVAVVAIQSATDRHILEGWPLAALAAVVVVSVIFYGGFIFNHAVNFSAEIQKDSGSVSVQTKPRSDSENGAGHKPAI